MLKAVRLLSILASAALLVSCAGGNPFPPVTLDFGQITPDAPRALSLPLDEKIGQLFVVPANGVYLSEQSKDFQTLRHHVVDNRVGGVILFRSNVYGAAVLVGKLQELAKVPLLVSADLEAGLGMRFEDVTYGPWAMAIAAAGDPALAERGALATAREARAIGIAQVFAPVADVNVNPDNPVINVRSFGEDPADVSRYVEATVKGLKDGGVLATLKHFPGHGDTATDSHRSLAIVGADRPRLESVELVSFRAGIKAGAESVMVAHVSVPALDDTPAPVLANPPRPVDAIGENVEVETKGTMPALALGARRHRRPPQGARLHGTRRDGRDADGRHHVAFHGRRGRRARDPRGGGSGPLVGRHGRRDRRRARGGEVGPDLRETPRRVGDADSRLQEEAEAVRERASPSWAASRRSSTRRPFRRSRPRSRGARSRSCASSPTRCRSGRARNCFRSSSPTRCR